MNYKNIRGNINVFMPLGIILMITIILAFFLLYFQINVIANNVRENLFYSANNALLAMDVEDLAYGKYKINVSYAKELLEDLLNKNKQGAITNITIENLEFNNTQNEQNIFVQVDVKFKTVINISGNNEYSFKMQDSVPISLLKYEVIGNYE